MLLGTFEIITYITVNSVIKKYAQSHEQGLQRHINVEALQLLNNDGLVRKLKFTKPF
jgi:hypothetical protein